MKRNRFVILIIISMSLLLSGGCTKYTKPYTQAEVLKFAEESYHKDFNVVKVKTVSRVPSETVYTLSPANNPKFTFNITSAVVQAGSLDGTPFGPYVKKLYSAYLDSVREYCKVKIRQLADKTNGCISTDNGDYAGFAARFSDLETIADFIVKADREYNFSYDPTVSNPISEEAFSMPDIFVQRVDSVQERDSGTAISNIEYSLYGSDLDYDRVLKQLRTAYIEKVKQGKFVDSTIPGKIYNETPWQTITKLFINGNCVSNDVTDSFSRIDATYAFVYDENLNDYMLRTRIGYPFSDGKDGVLEDWVTKYFGGAYKINKGSSAFKKTNTVEWVIGKDKVVAKSRFDNGDFKSIAFQKNGRHLDIKPYEEPDKNNLASGGTWDTWIRLHDLETLLSVKISVDQTTGTIHMERK